jgi:hypothetical protein
MICIKFYFISSKIILKKKICVGKKELLESNKHIAFYYLFLYIVLNIYELFSWPKFHINPASQSASLP